MIISSLSISAIATDRYVAICRSSQVNHQLHHIFIIVTYRLHHLHLHHHLDHHDHHHHNQDTLSTKACVKLLPVLWIIGIGLCSPLAVYRQLLRCFLIILILSIFFFIHQSSFSMYYRLLLASYWRPRKVLKGWFYNITFHLASFLDTTIVFGNLKIGITANWLRIMRGRVSYNNGKVGGPVGGLIKMEGGLKPEFDWGVNIIRKNFLEKLEMGIFQKVIITMSVIKGKKI